MSPNKVILLACGSFNPPTNMHLRMFEIARDHLHRMGHDIVVGGLVSPVHDSYGKKELESYTHRLAMIKLALQTTDWIKLSDWECKQENWCRTRQVLQHHQNQINAILHSGEQFNNMNEDETSWIPENVKNGCKETIRVKLLCGADLLESFGTPGLWADDDIDAIVGQHGLVVITRSNANPMEFIYNSDVLTKYMGNITIVTEWIRNEVSSTKIRRALRRSESVKYLLAEKVIDYIHNNGLYGSKQTKYYLQAPISNFLTPSPSDVTMESPSPTNCMSISICNNNLFSSRSYDKRLLIDTVDVNKTNMINSAKHPGQAVKIITDCDGEHKIVKNNKGDLKGEVCKEEINKALKSSKSCSNFDDNVEIKSNLKSCKSNVQLKECKNCDDNLIKFIFTKHGIQVISDVETIV